MTDDPLIGRQLANYKIERLIGRGGMAQVYYGQDVTLRRPAAIKVIDARNRDNPAYAKRFVRESRAVASWRHENIIQVYYAGDQDGLFYFAMEYIDGVDLGKQLARYAATRQKMPQAEVLRIGGAVAAALDYAHAQGVIHRDVKPANVLLAKDGRVVLSDFGLALDMQQGSLGEVFGSSQYIAPEQARRSADAVPQSDLYSLGVILYQALTGALPFDDPSPTTVALQHVTLEPPLPRKINPELNEGTSTVLLKALSKDPADRYQTGADLIATLERALRGVRRAAVATPPSKKLKSTEDLIGQQIDEYRLDLLLGQGGMACIYRGLDVRLNRYAAIKVIDAPHRADADYAARFKREAQAIAQLEHYHIVRLYRYGEVSGLLYMAMQYVEGRDLQAVLAAHRKKGDGPSPREISQIVREVCLALDYAHSRGVIHRDVKPSNIMIDENGHALLTDFGLALLTEVGSRGEIFGSPYYIAPEQAISSANATAQSDLYALGVILYEMFTGQVPFDAASPLDVAMLHMTEAPRPPRQLRPAISPQIEAVILKALAKEPRDRYPSGAALADAVDQALRAVPTKAEAKAAHSKGGLAAATPTDSPLPPIPAAVAAPATQTKQLTVRPAAARPRRRVYGLGLLLVVAVAVAGAFILNTGNILAPNSAVPVIPTTTLDLTQPVAEATITTPTSAPTLMPTVPPITTQLFSFKRDNVELRAKADPASQVQGLLPQATQFFLRARTADDAWLRIETPDGMSGWVEAGAIDLGGRTPDQLQHLPVATTLMQPTDTPTATPLPTPTPTPTKRPATAKPIPTKVTPTAISPTATGPLTLEWSIVKYDPLTPDNINWTATVRLYASGGDGHYTYAAPNPDGGFDYQTGPDAFFLLRWRRCRSWQGEFRVSDTAGNVFAHAYSIEAPSDCTLP